MEGICITSAGRSTMQRFLDVAQRAEHQTRYGLHRIRRERGIRRRRASQRLELEHKGDQRPGGLHRRPALLLILPRRCHRRPGLPPVRHHHEAARQHGHGAGVVPIDHRLQDRGVDSCVRDGRLAGAGAAVLEDPLAPSAPPRKVPRPDARPKSSSVSVTHISTWHDWSGSVGDELKLTYAVTRLPRSSPLRTVT